MLQIRCDEHQRKQMQNVLTGPRANCEIEEHGWTDGSTAWGFLVACFIPHVDSDQFRRVVRDAQFTGWFDVQPWDNVS